VLALLGGILTLVANNQQQPGGAVSLSARVFKAEKHLNIDYTLENNSDKTIYVWDVMTNTAGDEQVVDPALAYVFWEEPHTIRVVRAILDEPQNIHPVVREMPFVRKVQAHDSVHGQISLALPIQEYSPFYSADSHSKPVQCGSLRLMIGWIEHQQGMVLSERKVGRQSVLALRGSWPRPAQHIAEKTFSVRELLSVREDEFDRSFPLH
jgi:hypothetical protein